jgi:beta-N-acetylhexosaminidase
MSGQVTSGSRRLLAAVVALLVTGACGDSGGSGGAGDSAVAPATTSSGRALPDVAPTPPCHPAPLEDRAATVLVLGVGEAMAADDPLAAEVAALGVGGVVLLGSNIAGADQTRELIDGLRRQSPRPLLVAVDEEGGRVSRLRPIVGPTPSARALGQQPPSEIAAVAAERGAILDDLGFDLVLGPVFDADGGAAGAAIGDRSFAATPAEAGARAAAFVDGLARSGVAATAKHFPGQGELGDSHDGPVVFDAPLDQVEAVATAGFGPAVTAGAPAVMMSHVAFPALGPLPASAEPGAYRLLRSLGFEGVAVTDAMNMSAITERWPLPEATVMALAAGADIVLATPGEEATAMVDAVVAAVDDGRLPESRLDQAVGRVLALRGEDPSSMVCAG